MIERVGFLHYLSEDAYRAVCERFGMDADVQKGPENSRTFEGGGVAGIQMYNLVYAQQGRIWFLHTEIDFPRLGCSYDDFPQKLYEAYRDCFGEAFVQDAPDYDSLNCDYVEYARVFAVDDAAAVMACLREKCPREQVEKALWADYKKPNATIAFCLAEQGPTRIETLARCHGPALKKRIKDAALHRGTGVTPAAVVNVKTEKEITDWLWGRYV